MVTSQITSESLGLPPSIGSWLLAGKSSRKSHSKAKEGLFREETHSINRVWGISEGKRGTRVWGCHVLGDGVGISRNFISSWE